MSAIFPHDAVVQRYLHTGKRRSSRKAVIASSVAVLACVVVAVAVPGSAPKTDVAPPVQQAKSEQATSAPTAQPAARTASEAPTPSTSDPKASDPKASDPKAVDVTASVSTTGAATTNQPNAKPLNSPLNAVPIQANAAVSPNSAVVSVAAPPPTPAPAAQIASAPQPVAPVANVQAPSPVAVAATETADRTADVAAPKVDATKPAHKVRHALTRAEKRTRAARLRGPRVAAQPTLVRVLELPDGRRVYQRVTGDEAGFGYPGGGEIRRVYLAPQGGAFD